MTPYPLEPMRCDVDTGICKPLDLPALVLRIAMRHGITVHELVGSARVKHIMAARRELYRVLRALDWSYPAIGRVVGRDHTTVIHALRKRRK